MKQLMLSILLGVLLGLICAQGVLSEDVSTSSPSENSIGALDKKTTSSTTEKVPTTEAPTTTEAPPTNGTTTATTTVKPSTPSFPENVGTWSVTSPTNVTCIILSGAVRVSIPHANKTEKTTTVDVPTTASAKGECGEVSQYITLSWNLSDSETQNNLTFVFEMNPETTKKNGSKIDPGKYSLVEVNGFVNYMINKTKETADFSLNELYTFQIAQNKSYKCISHETVKQNGTELEIELARLKLEAFHTTPGTNLSTAVECALDGYVADIVPIAIGASLAGLVAIVLVAYLIGRRRSRNVGYQSV